MSEEKKQELKNCPCCGSEAEFKEYHTQRCVHIYIMCKKCELQTKIVEPSLEYCAKEEVAKAWNGRV